MNAVIVPTCQKKNDSIHHPGMSRYVSLETTDINLQHVSIAIYAGFQHLLSELTTTTLSLCLCHQRRE